MPHGGKLQGQQLSRYLFQSPGVQESNPQDIPQGCNRSTGVKHLAAQCGFQASCGGGGEPGVDEGARRGSVERGEYPCQLQKQLSEVATGLRQSLAWLKGGEAMPVKLKRSQAKKK